jgi:hypothetical protein
MRCQASENPKVKKRESGHLQGPQQACERLPHRARRKLRRVVDYLERGPRGRAARRPAARRRRRVPGRPAPRAAGEPLEHLAAAPDGGRSPPASATAVMRKCSSGASRKGDDPGPRHGCFRAAGEKAGMSTKLTSHYLAPSPEDLRSALSPASRWSGTRFSRRATRVAIHRADRAAHPGRSSHRLAADLDPGKSRGTSLQGDRQPSHCGARLGRSEPSHPVSWPRSHDRPDPGHHVGYRSDRPACGQPGA